jgi:hypothetical protein
MTVLSAHVENGAVVLDTPLPLPNGTRLRVEVVEDKLMPPTITEASSTLGERLLKFAGTVRDLPHDLAKQHDHYIHGCPKK